MEAHLHVCKEETNPHSEAAIRESSRSRSFSCGTLLQDYADLPLDMMDMVFARNLYCNEPIERLYYSAKLRTLFIRVLALEFDPQCEGCSKKSKIRKAINSTVTLSGPLRKHSSRTFSDTKNRK